MSKEPNNIDRIMREKLDGFEMTPPASVWESTSASLNAGRKKRFFLWFFVAFVFIAALGTSLYFFSDEESSDEQLALNQKTEKSSEIHRQGMNKKASNESDTTLNSTEAESVKNKNASNQTVGINENASTKSDKNSGNDLLGNESENSTKASHSAGSNRKSVKNDHNPNEVTPKRNSGSNSISLGESLESDLAVGNKSGRTGGEERTMLSDENSDSNRKSASNKSDNLLGNPESGETNDRSVEQTKSTDSEHIEILPTRPAKPFSAVEASINLKTSSQKLLFPPVPFWKSFSLEGAVGVSTFSNSPVKKSTNDSLINALQNASSQRNSLNFNLGINYHFNAKMSLQTGLEYSRANESYINYTTELTTFQYFDSIATGFDSISGDSIYLVITITDSTEVSVPNTQQNSYTVLTIPFHFGWTQSVGVRSKLMFALGGDLTIYSRNNGVVLQNLNNTIPLQNAYKNTGILSLGGSIKYLYYFKSRHAVYIQPWAQFGITNQGTSTLNYESLRRRYGVRVGYRIHL